VEGGRLRRPVLANRLFLRLALLRSRSAQQLGQGDASGLTINLPLKAGVVRMGGGDACIAPRRLKVVALTASSYEIMKELIGRFIRVSGQLLVNSEALPPLPSIVFCLAMPSTLSESRRADCKKASLPVVGSDFSNQDR
jgi:hypothetical protein